MDLEVLAVAVSGDGQQIICAGADPALIYWNAKTGERIRRQPGHGGTVHELCYSKDGQTVVSAASDRTVKLWNSKDGVAIRTLSAGSIAYATAISPNGKLVAAGGFDGQVRLFGAGSGKQLVTLLSLRPNEDKHDWLALTPEGFVNGSDGLASLGQWRMAGKPVTGDAWKALRQPEQVTKAARGDALMPPEFGVK
jgi:WD40 repeat protein